MLHLPGDFPGDFVGLGDFPGDFVALGDLLEGDLAGDLFGFSHLQKCPS